MTTRTVARTASSTIRSSRRALRWLLAGLLGYLVVGNALHHLVFPQPSPDPQTWPRPGDVLTSETEGFRQHIKAIDAGWVISELVLRPGAEGPPQHYHREFAEAFTVLSGTLHVELADRVVQVPAGETIRVEPGVAHRPFNPTAEPVVIGGPSRSIPHSFAACLVQLYSVMEDIGPGPRMLLQVAVNDPICDTHLAGIPTAVEWMIRLVLGPIARLAGYRNYYPERALHPPHGAT